MNKKSTVIMLALCAAVLIGALITMEAVFAGGKISAGQDAEADAPPESKTRGTAVVTLGQE
ncbi:MAG: hypothetical protein LBL36_00405 [Clostridiales Family XIII bacterium]|jgi:hypothetical protein|nr:hypothetical protein [Clostridiales Family XIII bacterium]